jgi:transposase-like protein
MASNISPDHLTDFFTSISRKRCEYVEIRHGLYPRRSPHYNFICSHTHIQTDESMDTSMVATKNGKERLANKAFQRRGKCKWCGSHKVVKNGIKDGQQLYRCNECKHQFHDNGKLPRSRKSKDAVAHALDIYYEGLSLRKTKRQINKFHKEDVDFSTVWRWIDRYTPLVVRFLSNFRPNLLGIWHADETVLKFRKDIYWHWDAIDNGTRFLVGNHISKTRRFEDAERFFQICGNNTPKPLEITTDSLHVYHKGINSVYYNRFRHKRVKHRRIRHVKDNISIERWHGTLKDRIKVMRGLKSPNTKIPDGFVVHYDYLRGHQSLKGNTPAKEAQIELPFEDGWGDLINWAVKWRILCRMNGNKSEIGI